MFTEFNMALFEQRREDISLADDFSTWFARVNCKWKPRKEIPMIPPKQPWRQITVSSYSQSPSGLGRIPRAEVDVSRPSTTLSPYLPTSSISGISTSSTSFTSAITSSSSLTPAYSPVFTTEFFEVRKSHKGGLGAFAIKEIPRNTVILQEKPLFRASAMEVYYEFENLSPRKQQLYRSLCYWKELDENRIMARFKTNRFETCGGKGGIFVKSSRFNHACHPYATCTYHYDPEKNKLTTTTLRNIKKGEEITISYGGSTNTLHENYGFWCDCPKCPPAEIARKEADYFRGLK